MRGAGSARSRPRGPTTAGRRVPQAPVGAGFGGVLAAPALLRLARGVFPQPGASRHATGALAEPTSLAGRPKSGRPRFVWLDGTPRVGRWRTDVPGRSPTCSA